MDCADPTLLAVFYRDLLDGHVIWESDGFCAVRVPGAILTMQKVALYEPPTWPDPLVPKQLHIEFRVADLDAATHHATRVGAVPAAVQPSPDRWLVFLDPAGHPFCLSALVPE